MIRTRLLWLPLMVILGALPESAPSGPGASWEPYVATYSIAALDPSTGEIGIAVTSRVPCIGNLVPHILPGVGAVVTQGHVNPDHADQILKKLAEGVSASDALAQVLAEDGGRTGRQIGIITFTGGSAQHTGSRTEPWSGQRSGRNYIVQGNILVGSEVLRDVSRRFEATAGSGRNLAERLLDALAAGEAAGGDARRGFRQSASLLVSDGTESSTADPRRLAVNIEVCEHPSPVAELTRVYRTISETLGYRDLQQFYGRDVIQLKYMLHALGYFRPGEGELRTDLTTPFFDAEAVQAVNAFREAQRLPTISAGTAPGLVDQETVDRLWAELERRGLAADLRQRFRTMAR
jgi:uncharacterized Ntn-hydrolase superfamily protein